MFGRISGSMTEYQKELFEKLHDISKVPKAELYRRAFDYYLIHQKEEFNKAGIEMPQELLNKDINSLVTVLPVLNRRFRKER